MVTKARARAKASNKCGSAGVKRSVITQLPGQTLALVAILVEATAPYVSADLLQEASGSRSAWVSQV